MVAIPENKPLQKNVAEVSFERGFHFCTHGGRYTGISAVSLADLAEILKTIDDAAITFHLERNDFQKWATDILLDEELAWKIDKLNVEDTDTRKKLIDIVRSHLNLSSNITAL
ncbi:MAG: DUF5752 family protein [Nitrososphaerota archaeon]|jgi:hypothetical protein|nr:DUF5752 family protein [Nitrososphaerota archaeon]